MYRLLLVDDELPVVHSIKRNLDGALYEIDYALDGATAIKMLDAHDYDAIICDLMMPNVDGFQVLEHVRKMDPHVIFIMITAFSSMGAGIKAMSMGAYDFLQKPFDHDHLGIVLEKGLKTRQLQNENVSLKAQLEHTNKPLPMIGNSPALVSIIKNVEKLSDSTVNILIEGESGTGKELLARHMHYHSPMRFGPFIPLNCASIPAELLETELFGHEKGSFTGATNKKKGLMETSNNGTFFLDEVNNLRMDLQAKLLRALQERSFRRVGGTQEISVNVRIISASNTSLKKMVEAKQFREDLYYRLNVVGFVLPPLRSCLADVPLLARHFLAEFCRSTSKKCDIDDETIEELKKYHWPGNIRELRNMIEKMVALYDASEADSMKSIISTLTKDDAADFRSAPPTDLSLAEVEHQHIMRVLEKTNWNKSEASRILKIDYTTLYRKLKKYGINYPEYKEEEAG